jgi:hypothetical protein
MSEPGSLADRLRGLAKALRVHEDGQAEAELVEEAAVAIDATGGDFGVYSAAALRVASSLLDTPTAAADALRWTRSARDAAEVGRLLQPASDVDDTERTALGQLIAALRAQLADAARERDGIARFLEQLAGEFESAQTPTATRVAVRIRRTLEDCGVEPTHEQDRNDAR